MAQTGSQNQVGVFSRRFQIDQIPAEGLDSRFEASAEEQAAIAEMLGLESLNSLSLAYELKPVGVRRFAVRGRLMARFQQICVVSLEAIDIDVDRTVEVEFVPEKEFLAPARACRGRTCRSCGHRSRTD